MGEYGAALRQRASHIPPVESINSLGRSPFVLVCDHASNRFPEGYGDLGLSLRQRLMHIAWDPGALAVALRLSELLDAPLVHSTVSRLIVDCNRTENAPDLVPIISERTDIPGNVGISAAERTRRVAEIHAPFHDAIDALLGERAQAGQECVLVAVHSFTPVYRDVRRPWPIGLIPAREESFATLLQDALIADEPELNVGWNQPYSAQSGVTYTLEHHSDERGIPAVMIEIRHDEILEPMGVESWAARLARCLELVRRGIAGGAGLGNEDLGQATGGSYG